VWQARCEEGARESTKREGANGLWFLHDKQAQTAQKGRKAPGAQLARPAQLVQSVQLVLVGRKAITWTQQGKSIS
jgi:hypothetical protein